MKTILILLISVMLLGCATSMPSNYFRGSWICSGTEHMSMMILREDGTCTFHMKVGSPWASTWEGLWKQEGIQLFIFDSYKQLYTVGNISGEQHIRMFLLNQDYIFHRYGSGQLQGGL